MILSPSPNRQPRPPGVHIDTVVLHATVLGTAADVCEHFLKEDPGVSAHYTIDRDGTVKYQKIMVNALDLLDPQEVLTALKSIK